MEMQAGCGGPVDLPSAGAARDTGARTSRLCGSVTAVAQQAARGFSGAFVVSERDVAVHHDCVIALRTLCPRKLSALFSFAWRCVASVLPDLTPGRGE